MMIAEPMSDVEWRRCAPFFPPERSRIGRPAKVPTRFFLDALLWMNRRNARWRTLPDGFGPWYTIWRRFMRWRERGVFKNAFAAMDAAGLTQERLRVVISALIRTQDRRSAKRHAGRRRATRPMKPNAAQRSASLRLAGQRPAADPLPAAERA